LVDTAAECRAQGAADVTIVRVDVTQREEVDRLMESAVRRGPLDVVVHCAGVVGYGDFVDIPADVFDHVIATNVTGSANVARAALQAMRQQQRGVLVLTSSVIGRIAVPRMSPYVVSKWAVRALARELQLETRGCPDIHVICLEPGSTDTPIYKQGATYAGATGRPPPPVVSPERVAARLMRAIDRPRNTLRVGPVNRAMELGFTLTPWLFDILVGPMAAVAALEDEARPPTTGNVFESRPEGNHLHGNQGNGLKAAGTATLNRLSSTLAPWVRRVGSSRGSPR
jgi:NAD(P)-dependent dehydrogenase (short-subunit alcohol dehydrogenase family)